ncbi:MAG: diaminopimelate epimerase [Myxococcales bacterium]|nr:diaminopimelate epimerase [Myxococcales bacterium]
MRFDKYQGLGNDFIVVDADRTDAISPERAQALCDRHFGIGADGVLLVERPVSAGARARMVVLNADGTRPEMCGNGIRCVALHLARADGSPAASYVIDTDAGPLLCEVERKGDSGFVRVGMGRGQVLPDVSVELDGRRVVLSRVSMGNPHAVSFDEPLDAAHADRLGPLVSGQIAGGSNVELTRARADGAFDLVVWERGVGRTLACGTGAAAAAVAAVRSGRASYGAAVGMHLPGGKLEIAVAEGTLEVSMRGPARRVFSGETSD